MPDRIRTEFVHPPIPTRQFDWSAVDDDTYDGAPDAGRRARIIGYGATEAEAIADLNSQMEDDMEAKHTPGPWTAYTPAEKRIARRLAKQGRARVTEERHTYVGARKFVSTIALYVEPILGECEA